MLAMAKRVTKPKTEEKRPGKKALSLQIDARLRDALDAVAAKNRRSLTAELEIALEAHFAKEGLWPPTTS